MSVSIPDFWKLILESRLLTPAECDNLGEDFAQVKGAAKQGNAHTLAEWLIAKNVLSRYQATVLLAGRPGPFYYGDYKVYDRFDKGPQPGMFHAVHASTTHPVVLHFLSGPATQNPRLWAALADQATAYCDLVHPLLTRIYELVDLGTFKFLAREDPPGQSLAQLLSGAGPLPAAEACRIARQAALALAELHRNGLAHGDVRPATVWIDPRGNVKLWLNLPAGAAPLGRNVPDPTGQAINRADYAAPELAQPVRSPDALSDIYSLGATTYHMIAGYPPFPGGSVPQKLAGHAAKPIRPLERLVPIARGASEMVTYMMAKRRTVRYQQAAVVAEHLAAYVDPSQQAPPAPKERATLPIYLRRIEQKKAAPGKNEPGETIDVFPTLEELESSTGKTPADTGDAPAPAPAEVKPAAAKKA